MSFVFYQKRNVRAIRALNKWICRETCDFCVCVINSNYNNTKKGGDMHGNRIGKIHICYLFFTFLRIVKFLKNF